jgi:hypothetical protein
MKHFSEMVMSPKEPEVGLPRVQRSIARQPARRYGSAHRQCRFVPNLGISRPYI